VNSNGSFYRNTKQRASKSKPRREGWLSLQDLGDLWGSASFAALDFETTGLDSISDRICEIGAVRLSASGMEEASFGLLVYPGRPIHPDASRVNGITDEMVKDARPVHEVLPDLLEFLGDSIIVAHNAPFDVSFLQAAAERAGLPAIKNRVADTRDLSKEAFPELPSYALQNLARSFRLDSGNAHRACDDARTCARLLALCAQAARRRKDSASAPPSGASGEE